MRIVDERRGSFPDSIREEVEWFTRAQFDGGRKSRFA
jgi:hypothetical protein